MSLIIPTELKQSNIYIELSLMEISKINWLDKLTQKNYFIIISAAIVILLFNSTLKEYFDQIVVDKIFNRIEPNYVTDIAVFGIAVFSLLVSISLVLKTKRIPNSLFIIVVAFFLIFSYMRFEESYDYKKFYFFPNSNYVDVVFLICGFFIIVKIWSWINISKEPVNYKSPFLVDMPIDNDELDKFGRKEFAKSIAVKIQSKTNQRDAGALAIGINGEWGSGKTSFMNMIKNQIDIFDRIIIEFNPWRSSSASRIIEDFFELLIHELKPYDTNLASSILAYAKTLTSIDENVFTKAANATLQLLTNDVNKNQAYESINASLLKTRKQILIFIDDLDRLDKIEIIEVLRLIRNTANFNNVTYVVSYDREYINEAVKTFNPYNYTSYIEKIFQVEFKLPIIDDFIFKTEITNYLKPGISEKYHKQLEYVINSVESNGICFTTKFLKTYRDLIRFSNSFLLDIDPVIDEVLIYDFYLLQLLKLKYPYIYDAIVANENRFFIIMDQGGTYELRFIKDEWEDDKVLMITNSLKKQNKDQVQVNQKDITCLERQLDDYVKQKRICNYERNLIFYLIKSILSLKQIDGVICDNDLHKSFAYSSNVYKYFALNLYEGDISINEFEKLRKGEYEIYKEKVKTWLNKDMHFSLLRRLEKIKQFSTQIEFENHVRILLEIGHFCYENKCSWFEYKSISYYINYPCNEGTKYKIYSSKSDYNEFLHSLFENPSYPPIVESRVIGNLTILNEKFKSLEKINEKYFREYCSSNKGLTPDFFELYNNTFNVSSTGNISRNIKIEELYRKYYKLNLKFEELSWFIYQSYYHEKSYFLNDEKVFKVFKDWKGFKKYIDSQTSADECLEEFREFYEKYSKNNYQIISFEFKKLKVTNRA